MTPPGGFRRWPHHSPFLERLGDLWERAADPLRFGFTVDEPKRNGRGFLHGGAVSTIADVCIGHALAASTDPPTRLLTSNLNVTYLGIGRADDWVEVVVTLHRLGRTIGAGSAEMRVGDRTIATASATFVPVAPGS